MTWKLTSIAAGAAATIALSGAAHADHRNHDDHSKHSPAEHAAASSGPAKTVDAFGVALVSKNEKLARKLLADDVVIAEGGGAERSFEEYQQAHLGADMSFMSGVRTTLRKRDEIVSGDIAVVISESEMKGTYLAKPVHSAMMETMVLKREDDDWRIHHIHWSSKEMKD
jgi:ketosteroid isomerase-like protein